MGLNPSSGFVYVDRTMHAPVELVHILSMSTEEDSCQLLNI